MARREYSVNVLFETVEAPGSIRISFYLGSGTDLVGQVSTLGNANMRPSGNGLTNYTSPLTTGLVEKQVALKAEDAVPYLSRELRWEIEQVRPQRQPTAPLSPCPFRHTKRTSFSPCFKGTSQLTRPLMTAQLTDPARPIPASQIPSLQIAVVSSIVTYIEGGTELPRLSDTVTHFAPTAGKDGGIELQAPPPIGIKAPASLDPN